MKIWHFALALVTLVAIGCSSQPAASQEPENQAQTPNTQAPPSGGNESVQIHTGGAGGVAPVTGSDSVAGAGGGGVGNAAKDQARRVGGEAAGGSLGQSGGEESGE